MKKNEIIKDILYEILDESKGWFTLPEICKIFEEKNTTLDRYYSSLKKILRYNRDIFICNHKIDAFKLVKYGSTDDKLKTGTIRKIVYDFLDRNETPKHIDEIFKYVKKLSNLPTRC